ncbi:MAG TPA: TonB-dependent receptor [Steroidobacteraceae bacterium]|nr:TonB-dependent receptor [Steroidobacteraceae bacterium]
MKAVSRLSRLTLSASALAAMTTPFAASAQQTPQTAQLEEIIVTAERRAESLQDIPIAISAFSGEDIEQSGVEGIESLKQLSPSLQFGKGPIDNFVSIRGIGAELINVSAEAGVSIAQDGVPFASQTMFDADFLDVERVEVLRGPQGTIAGRNATGGTVNIYSRRPTAEFAGQVRAEIGNYDRRQLEGILSGPIGGAVLGRLAVRGERADGWLKNEFTGQDFNDADDFKVRASLLAGLTDNLEAHLIFEHSVDKSSPMLVALGRARPDRPSYPEVVGAAEYDEDERVFSANYPSNRRVETDKGTLRLAWDLGPQSNFTAITGYVANTNSGQFGGSTIDPLVVFDYLETDVWQLSQELTFTTDLTDNQDLIVGGLYLKSNAHEPLSFGLPPAGVPVDAFDFTADQELESYAIYSQWRYRLTDNWRMSLGARYTRDKKDYYEEDFVSGFPLPIVDVSESWGAFTPRFALDYAPTNDMMFYASVSRGFKAGGINAFATTDGTFDEYEPEFVWNHEIGMKANWLDNRLNTTLAGFYMDYSDVQQNLRILNVQTGVLLPNVVNASDATIAGVEAGLSAQVTEGFKLTAAAVWLDATYDKLVTNDLVYPELGQRDLSGNRLARAPEWQFSGSAEYGFALGSSLGAAIRADYQWQSRQFFSFYNHELNSQESYGLLNLSVAVAPKDGRWLVSAFARNVTDEFYVFYAEANVPAGFPSLGGAVGPPRMYGLSLTYNL